MGIFGRVADIFKSNVNDALDKAENPEKMLKQMVIEMEEGLTKSTAALAKAMAGEQSMLRQLNMAKAQSADWEAKAATALKAGNTDLAKQALAKKVQADSQAAQFDTMYKQTSQNTASIKAQVEQLKVKLEEARAKQSMLIARAQMAKTQVDFAKTLGNIDSSSAYAKFEKMEKKVMDMEAEAVAFGEISGTTAQEDPFAAMEKNMQVDDELAKLMAKLDTQK